MRRRGGAPSRATALYIYFRSMIYTQGYTVRALCCVSCGRLRWYCCTAFIAIILIYIILIYCYYDTVLDSAWRRKYDIFVPSRERAVTRLSTGSVWKKLCYQYKYDHNILHYYTMIWYRILTTITTTDCGHVYVHVSAKVCQLWSRTC